MKNKQFEKIKTKTFGKIILIILWIGLAFIVFKGVVSILNPNKFGSNDIKIENNSPKKLIETNARAFAENFTREYITYYGDDEEYKKRVTPFISDNLELTNKKLFTTTYVNSINHKWTTDNTILVDCIVSGSDNSNITPSQTPKEDVFYIRSAVKVIGDDFIISNYPTFISEPKKVTLKDSDDLKGSDFDDMDKKLEILKIIESFLKAYYDGQNTEIQYFVENPKIKETSKPFKFDCRKDIIVKWDEKNEYYARIIYFVTKNDNKFIQNMEFKLKLKDDKFIITSYNTKI